MGALVEKLSFRYVKCTYDEKTSHLKFIVREEINVSQIKTYNVPVRHLHINDAWPTLLMCHGNGEDIGGDNYLEELSKKFNTNICMFDYSGYGLHTCRTASEDGTRKDVVAVYNYLLYMGINPEKIIIYGRSIGTGVACYLAYHIRHDRQRPQKLILVSPLYSAVKVVTNIELPFDSFRNYAMAPSITCSTLILHGNNDWVISHTCGKELSEKFPHLYKFHTLNNIGHNNIYTEEYYREINKFIQTY